MTSDPSNSDDDAGAGDGLRLDKWLWQARFFKTRTLAAAVATKRKIRINRMVVTKPHYKVRPGDVLTFAQGREIRVVRVLALGERRGPAPEARTLYEDIAETPPVERKAPPPPSAKKEAWGARGGIDPRRARKQARDAKMNGR